ncbi:AsnC family transcriptional regulator [Leucobacter tenebrionis]|uniref:AsnC family transcriptional regulator n=1 Tax=Leucobacter tenebrionis TaxID=2873270 RepID=UPI001CA630B9|nr:AsnC family transcriptional regulator [Leucobacter tenebrionis]QZY51342.1 Lrp/AsnC family transcriptional regulator [Leucobacter tenebrionis]
MAIGEDQVRRILREVRENGRVSYTEVSEKVGVPRQVVAAVVEEAVAENRIRLTATISPDLLGITRYSYLLLSTSGPSEPILDALSSMSETCFVSAIAGTYGVDAEVRVTSDEQHQEVLGSIRTLPGVSGVVCNVYERILVNIDSPLPTPATTPIRIDDVDRSILFALEQNGRATFRELGEASGVSAASARNRLHRLLQHRVVKVVGLPVRDHLVGPPALGLGIRVRGIITPELVESICTVHPEFLAISSGAYDLIGTISGDTSEELLTKLDALRGIEQVALVDAWSHLRIAKELYGANELFMSALRR